MKLLTKEELKNKPNGTLYIPFPPKSFTGELHMITGKKRVKGEWNGELPVFPFLMEEDEDTYMTTWRTTDNTWWELDGGKQKYAVLSKNEIRKMIDCLEWALTGCKSHFNQDEWWSDNFNYPLTDEQAEEYIARKTDNSKNVKSSNSRRRTRR